MRFGTGCRTPGSALFQKYQGPHACEKVGPNSALTDPAMKLTALGGALFLVGACTTSDSAVDYTGTPFEALQTNQNLVVPNNIPILDPTGFGTTFSTANGGVDFSGDFFQSLGTNGRRCVSCHVPTSGWTITPPQLQLLFD